MTFPEEFDMHRWLSYTVVLIGAAIGNDASAQNADAVVRNVTVIDVEAGKAVPAQTVVVAGGRIVAMHAGTGNGLTATTVIDGTGKFLIPGLFDAHVHLTPSVECFGPMLIANGVTCVRDTGAATDVIISLREQAAKGEIDSPDIVCTGAIIDGDPPVWPFSEPCDTPEEARAAVRKLNDAGVDQIKVYSLLAPEVYLAAIDEAHKVGLKVTGHIPNTVTLDEAIRAKQDCIEHMMGMEKLLSELSGDDDGERNPIWSNFEGFLKYDKVDKAKLRERLKVIREAGTTYCPTVVVMQGLASGAKDEAASDARMKYVPHTIRGFWSQPHYKGFGEWAGQAVPAMTALIGELHRAGIPLLVGTDLANPYVFAGEAVHQEMRNFQESGVPAIDVLRAATIVPAKFCGVDDRLGSIAPGKTASLVLLRASPLDDVSNVSQIEGVMLRGKWLDRAALDAMQAEVVEFVEASLPAENVAVKLEAPGEVVHRGRYHMKFMEFDAGVEDFIITRSDRGWHVRVHNQPQGGYQAPMLVGADFDESGNPISATWAQLTSKPVEAVYSIEGNKLTATAKIGGEAQDPQSLELPANALFSPPAYAAEFIIAKSLAMKPGETREFQAVSFGYPSWQASLLPYTITRHDDEKLALADGREITAQRSTSVMKMPIGEFTGETWLRGDGLMVKTVMKMPFGTFELVLDESGAKPSQSP
jgi:imidazolonepropionase-like amidohydrolase